MNLNDLISLISSRRNTVTLHPKYLFRGQINSMWSLDPSFSRLAKNKLLNRKQALQLERECINKFSISARNLLPLNKTISLQPNHNGDIDFLGWATVMQHYSAPTRLLDWSCSPWVALYFACCDGWDSDASLFIADFDKVVREGNRIGRDKGKNIIELMSDSASEDILQFIMPLNTNERVEAQQGRFSVCTNPLTDHAKIMYEIGALEEINIKKEIKHEVMEYLYQMNITARTLYPGIDGLGKSTYEYCNIWDTESILD
ncbi:FRG domain-containing protein [Aeromonas allosaccharophila]|uniref:FRG domain-containing protein n=1 Tax=Aeromonas allosaccharophila TaxID=656 RepID=UPI003419B569